MSGLDVHSSHEFQETGGKKSGLSEVDTKVIENTGEYANKLSKINTFLGSIEVPDKVEDEYRDKLLRQDSLALDKLLKLEPNTLGNLLQKAEKEIQIFLIQAQIDELNTKIELEKDPKTKFFLKQERTDLKKDKDNILIAEKKLETKEYDNTIAEEDSKLNAKYDKILADIGDMRGALSSLQKKSGLSTQTKKTLEFLRSFEGGKYSTKNISNITEEDLQEIKKQKENFINSLKENPIILESISKDLGGTKTKEYAEFKNTMISIDPSLRKSFDMVESNYLPNTAKIKLGTSSLEGVDLDSNILRKTEDNLLIEVGKYGRKVSLLGSNYKLSSELNPDNVKAFKKINKETSEKLESLNKELNIVDKILSFFQKSKDRGLDFNDAKEELKNTDVDLYNQGLLNSIDSFDNLFSAFILQKTKLEEEKQEKIELSKKYLKKLIAKNAKEAKEKDERKKETLSFLHSIGFDKIPQSITDRLIDYMNLMLGKLGLTQQIDLEKGEIGVNIDHQNNKINSAEKLAFIKLFNKILGGNYVDENIAYGRTSQSLAAQNQIQRLGNKRLGFFKDNLNKTNNVA